MVLPSRIRNYLEKVENDTYKIRRDQFIEDIKQPASWVLTFAQVIDIESCTDLLRVAPGWTFCIGVMDWDRLRPIDVASKCLLRSSVEVDEKRCHRGRVRG